MIRVFSPSSIPHPWLGALGCLCLQFAVMVVCYATFLYSHAVYRWIF